MARTAIALLFLAAGATSALADAPRRLRTFTLESGDRMREVNGGQLFRLDDPRLPALRALAGAGPLTFTTSGEERAGALEWAEVITVQVGSASHELHAAAELTRPSALYLAHGGSALLSAGTQLRVLEYRDTGDAVVMARGPAGSVALGRIVRADLRAILLGPEVGWPPLRNRPLGRGQLEARRARVSRDRTPLIDPETRTPCFELLAGTQLHVFGWTDGSGKVRAAVPGSSGWLEGLVDQAALEPVAHEEPVTTGIAGHLVGADAPAIVPVPIATPGPLSVKPGSVQLIHGGERYLGAIAVTDRGVKLFTRGRGSILDGDGQPFEPARHGAARYWLTDRGYTLDTRLDEVVLPGGAHLVRNPEVHGRALKDVW